MLSTEDIEQVAERVPERPKKPAPPVLTLVHSATPNPVVVWWGWWFRMWGL
jgi:hypothetical protein